ncbi:hypothetical protein [Halalkalibacillus halophilus]|uniref:hypothetical protein n=1 Tax=Halalkalibacillus halophilus TaxID=392827 RepID=UPI000402822F|nr:hypothetical protein [Halalkalibacillus halophilus]
MKTTQHDGMRDPEPEEPTGELNEDELIGYIMRNTTGQHLTYENVQAVLVAETHYLRDKGFIEDE